MNEPYRLRYTNQIVGFFLLIVLLITTAVSVILFSRLFVSRDHFFVTATEQEAKDLRTGTEVVVLGRTIGEVTDLRYAEDSDDVVVQLGIDSNFSDQITANSVVTLDRRFGVGTPVLTIRRRRSPNAPDATTTLKPGDSLGDFTDIVEPIEEMVSKVETTSDSIDEAAKAIKDSIQQSMTPALAKGSDAFESWESTSEALRPEALLTLAQIKESTTKIETDLTDLTRRLNELIAGEIRQSVVKISSSADAATMAAAGVEKTAQAIEDQSAQTGENVRKTLQALKDTAEQIRLLTIETREVVRIVRGEVNELPGTTRRVNDTIGDTQELVGDIQDHWLLRRNRSGRSPTEQLPPTSIRSGGLR